MSVCRFSIFVAEGGGKEGGGGAARRAVAVVVVVVVVVVETSIIITVDERHNVGLLVFTYLPYFTPKRRNVLRGWFGR